MGLTFDLFSAWYVNVKDAATGKLWTRDQIVADASGLDVRIIDDYLAIAKAANDDALSSEMRLATPAELSAAYGKVHGKTIPIVEPFGISWVDLSQVPSPAADPDTLGQMKTVSYFARMQTLLGK
jgi:hypothetical protein